MPSNHKGLVSVSIEGVTGGSKELTVSEAEISLTGNEWEKHPVLTGPGAPCIHFSHFLSLMAHVEFFIHSLGLIPCLFPVNNLDFAVYILQVLLKGEVFASSCAENREKASM